MSLNFENVGKEVIYNRSVDNIEDYVKGTIVGCYIGQNEEYYITSIESSGECIKISDDSLLEIIDSGGGSGAVSSVNGQTGTVVLDAEDVGAEPEKVDVTFTESNSNWSCDKTFQQISDAYTANKIVKYYINRTGYTPTISIDASVKNNEITVTFLFSSLDMPVVYTFILSSNDSITFSASPLKDNKQTISGTTPTITPVPNNIYKCGELTSLTITDPPATGEYSIVFTSGSTATSTTIPSTILGLESFAAEANTIYEINVFDNRAVVGSWAVSA